jgi:hypothetical protein
MLADLSDVVILLRGAQDENMIKVVTVWSYVRSTEREAPGENLDKTKT